MRNKYDSVAHTQMLAAIVKINKMKEVFDIISKIADLVTLISLFWAIAWSIYLRKRTLIGLKVNVFLVSLLRITVILIFGALFFQLWKIIYVFSSILFVSEISSTTFYWNDNYPFFCILSYGVSIILTAILYWLTITIIWTSSFEHVIDFINIWIPRKIRIKKKDNNKLEIVDAKYGIEGHFVDVTEILNKMIVNNKLAIIASNELAGDPIEGTVKELKIKYKINNYETKELSIVENESATIEVQK